MGQGPVQSAVRRPWSDLRRSVLRRGRRVFFNGGAAAVVKLLDTAWSMKELEGLSFVAMLAKTQWRSQSSSISSLIAHLGAAIGAGHSYFSGL